jgi:hypothetical protein
MRPDVSSANAFNRCPGDIELSSNVGLGKPWTFRQFTNLKNLLFRQFNTWVFFSFSGRHSSFFERIIHVIRNCSHKKMRWITATRIVAGVATIQMFGYRAASKFVSGSVSVHILSIFTDAAIPLVAFISRPRPTFFGGSYFYFCPKPTQSCNVVIPFYFQSCSCWLCKFTAFFQGGEHNGSLMELTSSVKPLI